VNHLNAERLEVLTSDAIKPFLVHEDPYVRAAVAESLGESWARDPDLVPMVLEACDRYGAEGNERGLYFCHHFVLTEPALGAVLKHLAATNDDGAIRDLNRTIVHASAELVIAHEAAIRDNPHFHQDLIPRLERRRDLASWSGEELWEELQDFARRSDDKRYVGEIDHAYADDLVDALARRDVPDAATLCQLLCSLEPEQDWLETFAVDLAGARRIPQAIPALVEKFHIDTDYLLERSKVALAKIGDPEACRLIRAAYPTASDHFKIFTSDVFGAIKHAESEDAILALLETETDPTHRTILCSGLCQLFSERSVEVVKQEIASGYDTTYTSLEEDLLPVAGVLGIELPEAEHWREQRTERERRLAERMAELEELDRRYQARKAMRIDPFAPVAEKREPTFAEPVPRLTTPIVRTGRKVVRNDPCPCGSGKKYKKCCGRSV
jgi:hypothetical protein